MNFRAVYNDGFDASITAQDMPEAEVKAKSERPVKVFSLQPRISNRDCLRLLDRIEQRFHETLDSGLRGEERTAALRLLLREVHMLRNDYWIDLDENRGETNLARSKTNQLSNTIFEAF